MRQESVDQSDPSPDGMPVPVALDLPASGTWFTARGMRRKVRVLFIVQHPTVTPAISVHATLMRFFNQERVEVHAVYNRLAAREPPAPGGTSVLDVLPATVTGRLRPVDFGPVGGASRSELLAAAARALVPAIRDSASLVRYVQRNRIDIIHCEEGTRNALYALALARMTRTKCVVHFHLKYGDWMSPLSRFAIQRADAIIAVSCWTGRMMARAGVPSDRIFPVLNGIDVDGWDPSVVDGTIIRREFELGPEDPVVVMVAQLVDWKRQTLLIDAFATVAQRYPKACALIVGKEWSPAGDPRHGYAEKLSDLIAKAGLDRHVKLVGQRGDVRQILAAADIFVLPSVDDPCALAHIEALAMATPVVAVRAGGTPELVEDGNSGLLGPADDSAKLAANIMALIDDEPRRREMGAHGRRHVREYLNAKRMADDVEGVYRRVLGSEHS